MALRVKAARLAGATLGRRQWPWLVQAGPGWGPLAALGPAAKGAGETEGAVTAVTPASAGAPLVFFCREHFATAAVGPAYTSILAPSLRPLNTPSSPSLLPLPYAYSRPLSTHVGQGSGGRADSPPLHEPPDSHPFAVKGLNHIALAVPSLQDAAEHYRTVFGAQVSDPHPLPKHGVTVVFVHVGSTTIELLEPLGESSPIAKFLEKHPKGGLHHLCFTVDNIDIASQHVSEEGVRVLGVYSDQGSAGQAGSAKQGTSDSEAPAPPPAPKPQLGAHGNPVIFLDPRDNLGVLCELEQVFCHER